MSLVPYDTCDWCGDGNARPRMGVFLCDHCAMEEEFEDALADAFADDGPQAPPLAVSEPINQGRSDGGREQHGG